MLPREHPKKHDVKSSPDSHAERLISTSEERPIPTELANSAVACAHAWNVTGAQFSSEGCSAMLLARDDSIGSRARRNVPYCANKGGGMCGGEGGGFGGGGGGDEDDEDDEDELAPNDALSAPHAAWPICKSIGWISNGHSFLKKSRHEVSAQLGSLHPSNPSRSWSPVPAHEWKQTSLQSGRKVVMLPAREG